MSEISKGIQHPFIFWGDHLRDQGNSIAFIEENGSTVLYSDLDSRVAEAAQFLRLKGTRKLGLLFMGNTVPCIVAYLACLRAEHVPVLLPDTLSSQLVKSFIQTYQPDWVIRADQEGVMLPGSGLMYLENTLTNSVSLPELAPELGLLLSTSGTTGSPKLVRLSYHAVQSNSEAISDYLCLAPGERALTLLPPSYSYGLSIINSHLNSGGCIVLYNNGVLSPDFAKVILKQEITSISGVPYIYQMMYRTGFHKQAFPSLRSLTQAGGRMDDRLINVFGQLAIEKGWKFYVMYGQTEAAPRISFVPPERLLDKVGSIGVAIPGGNLYVDPLDDELIYEGPNVMLGYAESRLDLARPDELKGVLRTGDLARVDGDGYFYITGRKKRFVKLAGNRVGLDEVEQKLQSSLHVPASVGGRDERMVIWLEGNDENLAEAAKLLLADQYSMHHSMFRIRVVKELPLLQTGKKDYVALMEDA
jgi:long-chain acyl-CoA synthetase